MIFVSYAWANAEAVKPVVAALRAKGLELWIDVQDGHPASRFMEEIQPAIVSSTAFLMFCSRESLDSAYCQRELETAQASGTPLFPLWLQDPRELRPLPTALEGLTGLPVKGDPAVVAGQLAQALAIDSGRKVALRLLQVAAGQWERANGDMQLLLKGQRLEDARALLAYAEQRGAPLAELERRFVETSGLDAAQARQEAQRLEGAMLIQEADRLLGHAPEEALQKLLGIAVRGRPADFTRRLRQALATAACAKAGQYGAAKVVAASAEAGRWAGAGHGTFGCYAHCWPLADDSSFRRTEGKVWSGEVHDMVFRPGTTQLCLAGADGCIEYADTTTATRSDGEREEFKLKRRGGPHWLWRTFHNDMVDSVFPVRWLRDPFPTQVRSISFSPDGRLLASAHADGLVRVHAFDSWRLERCLPGLHADSFVRFSSSGSFLLCLGVKPRRGYWRWQRGGMFDGFAGVSLVDTRTWSAKPWPQEWPHAPWTGRPLCARLSDNDALLFVSKEDEAYVVDLRDGDYLRVPHRGVTQAEFSIDGQGLLTVGIDNVVRGWRLPQLPPGAPKGDRHPWARARTETEAAFALAQPTPVHGMVRLDNGRWVLVATQDHVRPVHCGFFGSDEAIEEQARAVAGGQRLLFP